MRPESNNLLLWGNLCPVQLLLPDLCSIRALKSTELFKVLTWFLCLFLNFSFDVFQIPRPVSRGRATPAMAHVTRPKSCPPSTFPMDLHSYFKLRMSESRPVVCRQETSVAPHAHHVTHQVRHSSTAVCHIQFACCL